MGHDPLLTGPVNVGVESVDLTLEFWSTSIGIAAPEHIQYALGDELSTGSVAGSGIA